MRLNNKYKLYNRIENISDEFHTRLLKFKRPKWKRFQKNISNFKSFPMQLILNNFCIKNNYKIWDKVKNYYKQGVASRNVLYNHFDRAISIKDLNKSLKFCNIAIFKENILKGLIKPEYRIDILLWRLKIFNSSFQARQNINSGHILINNKIVAGNYFLKKGDIISFKDTFNIQILNLLKNYSYFSISKIFITFVEVDYYTNTIIVVKDISEIDFEDIYLLKSDFYDLKKIKDFI